MKQLQKDLEIKVRAGKKLRSLDLAKELDINEVDINEQMMTQPRMFAWVAVLSKLAADTKRRKKAGLKVAYAERDKHWRIYREDHNLKVTDKVIDADILRDKVYQAAQGELHDAEFNADVLDVAVQAFDQRKDMLISVGANIRAEGDTNLSILKEKAKKTMKKKL